MSCTPFTTSSVLQDVLEKKEVEKVNEDRAGVLSPPEVKPQELSDKQPAVIVPQPPEAVDSPQDAVIGKKDQEQLNLNFDLKEEVKEELGGLVRQDKEINVVGDNGGERGEDRHANLKRDLGQLPLEEEKPVQGLGGKVDVGVAGGQDKEEAKEEAKEEMREGGVQDARGEEVVDEGREQDEARKVRELKAMDKS